MTTVVSQFHRIVQATPDAVALADRGRVWTYRALDAQTNAQAAALIAHGVQPGDAVVFAAERSAEAAMLCLAVLKAGAAYVPLDPASPPARWERMVRTLTQAHVLCMSDALGALAAATGCPCIEWPLPMLGGEAVSLLGTGDDCACVLFTSGSTGDPKGVAVPHRGILRLVCDVDYLCLGPGRSLLHAAPLAFDASTLELWGAWLTGGCCVIHHERIPTAAGLGASIRQHGVTTLWLTAGLFNAIVDEDPRQLSGVAELVIGGEALSVAHVRRAQQELVGTTIINGYGPTESTTFATTYRIPLLAQDHSATIPIGFPIPGTTLEIMDADGTPVVDGAEGELWIGGAGVALGYVGQPERTAERFRDDPQRPGTLRYRTGDLVRRRPDGALEFRGRVDAQVKIGGYRIELEEIERALLTFTGVRAVAVVAAARGEAQPLQLVAFVVPTITGMSRAPARWREGLRALLPRVMVPAAIHLIDALPLTANGKVDRGALAARADVRAEGRAELRAEGRVDLRAAPQASMLDATALERTLQELWESLLDQPVAPTANLFDLGASSLLVIRAVARLRTQHGLDVPAIRCFEHPTIRGLAEALAGSTEIDVPSHAAASETVDRRIAIVGAAVRLPGAPSLDAFWALLDRGGDAITRFTDETLDPSVSLAERQDPQYVRARGILDDVDQFDPGFFGLSLREAQLTDPQQRLWLELAWEALEDAGLVAARSTAVVGVFGGVYNNSYLPRVTAARPDLVQQYGEFNAMLLNEKDYVAPRVAHRLGLRGPAVSVHTACSTSLVAICQAVQNLRDGSCDVALAGGVSLTMPTRSGYRHQEGSMLSPDGVTRPFDEQSQGTVFSDGAGVVVLKRYQDAVRDGDRIEAVIRGVGVNNDGAGKASFTAPSVTGQADVLRRALDDAGVRAADVHYIEAHGTATPLGDPIEVEALRRVFMADQAAEGACLLGSVKSNIGHTVIGAGVAGLLKVVLALRHERLPGTAHYERPNPALSLPGSPFRVAAESTPWPRGSVPRLAGISSFGVGGTNAHLIVEEAPLPEEWPVHDGPQLLPLSARSSAALDRLTAGLASALEARPDGALASVAETLQRGRSTFDHRRAVVATSIDTACEALRTTAAAHRVQGTADAAPPSVAFLLPGQGAQYPAMGRALYTTSPVFREAFDRCARVADVECGLALRALIDQPDGDGLHQTAVTQPALYATSYAMAMHWMSWGVRPSVLVGHSVGEFVAAALAGVFSVEDGMRLVCARGRMMQSMPAGQMLAVAIDAAASADRLPASVSIAADNGPAQCVLSGPSSDIDVMQRALEGAGVQCRLLATSHAFHSGMMDPVVREFGALVRAVALHPPTIPIQSTVTAERLSDADACDPEYWTRHLRATVRFGAAVRALSASDGLVLLEVGPGATLSRLARRQATGQTVRSVASLPEASSTGDEAVQLATAAAQLWCWGASLDWNAMRGPAPRAVTAALPTYPFERQRCWVDADLPASAPAPSAFPAPAVATSPASTSPVVSHPDRSQRLLAEVRATVEEISGESLASVDADVTFAQLGLDSLVLTQVALALSRRFGVRLAFRQLLEATPSMQAVAQQLDRVLPADAPAPVPAETPASVVAPAMAPAPIAAAASPGPIATMMAPARVAPVAPAVSGEVHALIAQQLQLLHRQLDLLTGTAATAHPSMPMSAAEPAPAVATHATTRTPAPTPSATLPGDASVPATSSSTNIADPGVPIVGPDRPVYDASRAFGAAMRVTVSDTNGALSPRQRARLEAFIRRYTARTAGSKRYTAQHRMGMADPRAVTGFRPLTKELVYPIVMTRSAGARMWDVDGNEYIDVLSGFGSNLLGWTPAVVTDAIRAQLDQGFEIGPQHLLAGEVAERFRAMTGAERVAFCSTGSEAVLGAIRIARTVTGRPLIAIFSGSYHGINDEVIVRGRKDHRAVPAAPGILGETAANVLVLDYGTPESLATLEARSADIAAVLVEPVQSRRPDFQPREFLAALRDVTARTGMVYIWDEIVTGFRAAPGGAQELFGIRGDLATYGKIVGGGLPIGVIAGKREFMDALDGGAWQYGDASVPEVGVTYFAGTFVRHPLALASAKAMLDELARRGPALQQTLTQRTTALAEAINARAQALGFPLEIRHFASVWKTFLLGETVHSDLFFYALRDRGLHIYDGFPCFLTAAHGEAECAEIVEAFAGAMEELQEGAFFPQAPAVAAASTDPVLPRRSSVGAA